MSTPSTFSLPSLAQPQRFVSLVHQRREKPLTSIFVVAAAFALAVSLPASGLAQSLPNAPTVPPISTYTPAPAPVVPPLPTFPLRLAPTYTSAYRRPSTPSLFPGNPSTLLPLIHGGKLFLSAHDAITLALENNLDIEIERDNLLLADTDRLRAAGGGSLRGIDYTIQQPPNGVGGPGSPLLNTTAVNPNPTSPTVTDLTALNSSTQLQTNLSGTSTATAQFALGPSIPLFDPNFFFESGFLRRSDTVTLTTGGSSNAALGGANQPQPVDFLTANLAYIQGFRTGAQVEAAVNNSSQVFYGTSSSFDPFSRPSTSVTLTQPILRGFGKVNTRYIRIASVNRSVSRLLFEQQVLETVYGISRIYFDLVSLGENVTVKQQALTAARKLRDDDAAQVEIGTLAPIELTRVSALVTSSEFDLIQAQGLYRQQEVILRNQILRAGSPLFPVFSEIVPTDTITVPVALDPTPVPDLITQALARRPDLAQSELQIKAGQIALSASRNQILPQLNAYANVETRGSSEQAYEQLGTPGTAIPTLPSNFALGGLRVSTIVQAGVQLNLPLRNRVAQSDAARDAIQLHETEARAEKLSNQIRQDIENASIALETSFAALRAARASLVAQQTLLSAERDKLEFAQSTPLAILQNEAYVAQAESTEIAARSNFQKARIELDRNLGILLDKNHISLESTIQGHPTP